MDMELYQKARTEFVNGFKNYLVSDDVSELVLNVVIPYFEPLACDLDDIIDEIFNNNEQSQQTLDYIELVFNSKLYDSLIAVVKEHSNNSNLNYTHYLIILVEFVKYKKYLIIENALKRIHDNNDNENNESTNNKSSILEDVLAKATQERKQYCLDKIKSTYTDLVDNYPQFTSCINVSTDLVHDNNLI